MQYTQYLGEKVLRGRQITREEAIRLYHEPLEELSKKADEIRKHFCGDGFDVCTIMNAKSGKCSENCKFCAQSVHFNVDVEIYDALSEEEIVNAAKYNEAQGVLRFSLVTSGRKLSDREVDRMCGIIRRIRRETNIAVCVSFGLLDEIQYRKLKNAGATRVHNNLETSKKNFSNLCTTHTFEDKVEAIKAAQKVGLTVCSGGIMGVGETVEDRIDMAFSLRELGIRSIPINLLNPIPGTPMGNQKRLNDDELKRIVAVYRFIHPGAAIRLGGGRGLLADKGESCFCSGANATISGDMLTTAGVSVKADMKMIQKLGYQVRYQEEEDIKGLAG